MVTAVGMTNTDDVVVPPVPYELTDAIVSV